MNPIRIGAVSSIKAETKHSPHGHRNHAMPRSYIALLSRGIRIGAIERKFLRREKQAGFYRISSETRAGDIYEIRRWWWDHDRNEFLGGTVYVGFNDRNRPTVMTREEAFNLIWTPPISFDSDASVPARRAATRMIPQGVDVE